jgi:hypothetical protein
MYKDWFEILTVLTWAIENKGNYSMDTRNNFICSREGLADF